MRPNWITKIRPQILAGVLCLTLIVVILAVFCKDYEFAGQGIMACIVGITTMLTRLIDIDKDDEPHGSGG